MDIYSYKNNDANKTGLLLARTRYLEQLSPFVRDSKARLAYVEKDLQRIVKECAEATNGEVEYIDENLRRIIADDLAVTKPKKIKLEFGNGGEAKDLGYGGGPSFPGKYDPEQDHDTEPTEVSDTSYHTGPILEKEIREPDAVDDLKDNTTDYQGKGLGVTSPKVKSHTEDKKKSSVSALQKHSPYGVPKDKGGDSPENDSKMERCVEKVMAEGHSKESAIKICKSSIFGDKKSCVSCKCEIDDGVVCEKCSTRILSKVADMYGMPGTSMPGVMPGYYTPPSDPTGVTPGLNTPGQNSLGQMTCPGCGQQIPSASMQEHMEAAHPDQELNVRQQNPQMMGPGGQMGQQPSYMGAVKEAQPLGGPGQPGGQGMPGDFPYAPEPQVPQQPPQEPGNLQQPDPLKADKGLSDGPRARFDTVVSEIGNRAAAQQMSVPSNDVIEQVAQQYGLDPNEIRQSLKIVATFGESVAVNGEENASPDTQGYVPVEGVGGQVSDQEAIVPTDLAIERVADELGMDSGMVRTSLTDSFGGMDPPNQYHTPLDGNVQYFLPSNMINAQRSPMQEPMEVGEPDNIQNEMQTQPAH